MLPNVIHECRDKWLVGWVCSKKIQSRVCHWILSWSTCRQSSHLLYYWCLGFRGDFHEALNWRIRIYSIAKSLPSSLPCFCNQRKTKKCRTNGKKTKLPNTMSWRSSIEGSNNVVKHATGPSLLCKSENPTHSFSCREAYMPLWHIWLLAETLFWSVEPSSYVFGHWTGSGLDIANFSAQ